MDNQNPNIGRTENLLVNANGGKEPPKEQGGSNAVLLLFLKSL